MLYSLIPLILLPILAAYILYIRFIKKDSQKAKSILYPTLVFVGIWSIIYVFLFK